MIISNTNVELKKLKGAFLKFKELFTPVNLSCFAYRCEIYGFNKNCDGKTKKILKERTKGHFIELTKGSLSLLSLIT